MTHPSDLLSAPNLEPSRAHVSLGDRASLVAQLWDAADDVARGRPFPMLRSNVPETQELCRALNAVLDAAAMRETARLQQLERHQEVMLAFEELAREQASELARQNEALQQQNEALRAANELKTGFVAVVSHELRTPLNAVLGFSELLSGGVCGPVNEEQQRYLRVINRSGKSLLAMINDMLDLARSDAGRMEFNRDFFDLREPVVEAEQLVSPLARQKLQLLTLRADAPVTCVADPERVRQIALNLLSNAVKFTPRDGTITVTVRAVDGFAELEVRDTGIGIHPSHHARVFEAFRQVNETASREHKGTGLGLALVKRFAEGMGGTVSLRSAPGQGATFTVRLPTA